MHAVNRGQLFEGRPEHLLRAVIVVEVTVDREGRVTRSKILRSPGIASLDTMALGSLKASSPLPAPPSQLVAKGPLVFSETWLVRKDGRFQLRSLALPQE
ncbi:MAG: energy transducer TonB [Burkholderiales bacterium]|nr:energy transducer TonB [Burkholderiales bacterium]